MALLYNPVHSSHLTPLTPILLPRLSWDEWVPETRLLKFNEENIAQQKQLIETQRAKDKAEREALKAGNLDTALSAKSGMPSSRVSLSATGGGGTAAAYINMGVNATGARGTKRSRESVMEEDEFRHRPEIKLVIPDLIKVKLVDDWEAITKNAQLIPLPRIPSVSTLLASYASTQGDSSTSSGGHSHTRSSSLVSEVIAGLKLYFNKSLGNNLLYRFERGQYGEMKKRFAGVSSAAEKNEEGEEHKEMSEVYGVEHLLRLFGESLRLSLLYFICCIRLLFEHRYTRVGGKD